MDSKKEQLYNQSLSDLLRVVVVLSEILENKELTKEEETRINYGTKVIDNVAENQRIINKL